MRGLSPAAADRFRRYVLPGLAFKAVVIGGGYATGRELAEFFLPSGPRGGLAGMLLAMLLWSGTEFPLCYALPGRYLSLSITGSIVTSM